MQRTLSRLSATDDNLTLRRRQTSSLETSEVSKACLYILVLFLISPLQLWKRTPWKCATESFATMQTKTPHTLMELTAGRLVNNNQTIFRTRGDIPLFAVKTPSWRKKDAWARNNDMNEYRRRTSGLPDFARLRAVQPQGKDKYLPGDC